MKDKLGFDVTDASTILDSDSVGSFVRAGDDGTLIGHVSDALKVNFSNTSLAVTATDLDIRDLVFATDKVDVSGSEVSLDSATLAALENITVSATDLDIRDLAFATDKVDVSGSEVSLDSATLAALENITVSATDLDIRDLTHVSDSIKIGDGTDFLAINADGSINVNADISVVNGHEKAEDAAHSSGDIGSYMLGVRQDVLASSTSADGDYASFKMSAAGALYVNLAESSASITVNDAALANSAIISKSLTLGVADTAQAAVTSALAARKYLNIYNNDNNKIFVGGSGVTAANGFPVSPGSYLDLRAGVSSAVFFVGSSGKTPQIRTLELS
jgi:hypothetical protein